MMKTSFYILLNRRTAAGLESFGRFDVGNDRLAAETIFERLEGSLDIDENVVLCIELMETVHHLPVNIRMKACSLEQLAANCKLITKEIFRNAAGNNAS
jgi:hypothetical protein